MFEREKIISYSKTLKGTGWVVEGFQDEDMRLEGESDQVHVHLAPHQACHSIVPWEILVIEVISLCILGNIIFIGKAPDVEPSTL